jgi:hypothetical protein
MRKIHIGNCQAPEWMARKRAVEVRPFEAKTKPRASEAQGLSSEEMKRNPTTTVIPESMGAR